MISYGGNNAPLSAMMAIKRYDWLRWQRRSSLSYDSNTESRWALLAERHDDRQWWEHAHWSGMPAMAHRDEKWLKQARETRCQNKSTASQPLSSVPAAQKHSITDTVVSASSLFLCQSRFGTRDMSWFTLQALSVPTLPHPSYSNQTTCASLYSLTYGLISAHEHVAIFLALMRCPNRRLIDWLKNTQEDKKNAF